MSAERSRILEELTRRVAARTGLDRAAAERAIEDARNGRGKHLAVVGDEFRVLFDERVRPALDAYRPVLRQVLRSMRAVCTSLAPVSAALETVATVEAREGIRDHERGLRFAHRHPDMAALDCLLDGLYERPGS